MGGGSGIIERKETGSSQTGSARKRQTSPHFCRARPGLCVRVRGPGRVPTGLERGHKSGHHYESSLLLVLYKESAVG